MGKTTGSQTTKYELSPEQRQIMSGAMQQYMPGGQLPTSAPTFDFNSNPGLQALGAQYTAPFSQPTLQAFGATEANYGAQQPTLNAAKGLTLGSAADAGQGQAAPEGWQTDQNGQAKYQDYASGIQRYMSPYVNDVIGTGLGFLDQARQRANLDTTNNSIARGSFGGTRQAVRQSLNDTAFAAQAQNLITGNLQHAYEGAQNQYNTGFGQGQEALKYNLGMDQVNRQARLAAGGQLGGLAKTNQDITGGDINALANVGGQIEAKDQAQRDAARAAQLQNNTYGLNIAQALAGFAGPPSSTTSNNVSGSSIWGSAGGAGLGALAAFFSDKRAKKKLRKADPEESLAAIRKLRPRTFEHTDDAKMHGAPGGRRTGFYAHDLEDATGQPSPTMPGGYKGVDMAEHIGRLTHAVQALDQQMRSKYGGKRPPSRAA